MNTPDCQMRSQSVRMIQILVLINVAHITYCRPRYPVLKQMTEADDLIFYDFKVILRLMRKAQQLDESTRRCVIELFEVGVRAKDIAIRLRISKSSVSRLMNLHLKTGSTKVKPRSGRPPKITTQTKRRLRRKLSANPFSTPCELQNEISPLRHVSQRAIRRYCAQLHSQAFMPGLRDKNR